MWRRKTIIEASQELFKQGVADGLIDKEPEDSFPLTSYKRKAYMSGYYFGKGQYDFNKKKSFDSPYKKSTYMFKMYERGYKLKSNDQKTNKR